MAGRVVVHSVDSLSSYSRQLAELKVELESTASKLVSLSDELQEKASVMGRATDSQGSNWQDPQYGKLRGEITTCITAVNSTSTSVKGTAATIKSQMAQVEGSISYIQSLVSKLSDIS